MSKSMWMIALVLLQVGNAIAQNCDTARGQRNFATKCALCHVAEPGAASTVGPNLHGVVGRAVAVMDFSYSDALQKAGGFWDEQRLEKFLTSPQTMVPGTAMPFQGMKSASERQTLICYLNTLK